MNIIEVFGRTLQSASIKTERELGIHTDSPFTRTRYKSALSSIGLGLEGERGRIRRERSAIKRAEWEPRKKLAVLDVFSGMKARDAEQLIFQDHEELDVLAEPYQAAILESSDATQEEVDFLIGKSNKDPRPMHRVNYDAGNTDEHRVEVIFPPKKRPLVAFSQESEGEAMFRVGQELDEIRRSRDYADIDSKNFSTSVEKESRLSDQLSVRHEGGRVMKGRRPLERHRWIDILGIRISLPSQRQRIEYPSSLYSHW